MTSTNLLGFIFLSTNMRCFRNSENFKTLLNACLARKFFLSKPTGVVSIKSSTPSSSKPACRIMFLVPMLINKMGQQSENTTTIEVGLSLLAHASMPLKYWDEAFLAATYLINYIPTKVIEFSSPLELLFKEKPNYSGL
jgi:hypothetical protein